MFGRRHRSRLDQLRGRFDRSAGRPSASLVEAEARLSSAVDRHFVREAADRAAADRLTQAFDLIPQGIVLADADGTVRFRNRAASGFVDARHSEALVESAITELIADAVRGESRTQTFDLFGPPRRAIQLRAGPLRPDPAAGSTGGDGEPGPGEVAGAFVMVEDVSERQRLEAVRRDFVANISHELKTPVGALGVLAESLAGEDDLDVVHRLAGRMQREAFRVAHTIDDLLQLSRIEVGRHEEPEVVSVRVVIEEAVERTRPAAELRSVELQAAPVPAGLTVCGDRRQLVSALANVCENAVKYSDEGGGSVVTVAATGSGEWVELTVADRGLGIPARDLERIFERFYRVDRARSRDTGGTGLGLAIVRHVVQNHQGEVSVASREGEGTTFVLRLPADFRRLGPATPMPADAPRLAGPSPQESR